MPEGQCTWRGTWQLSKTDPTIVAVADFRPTLELQYNIDTSIDISIFDILCLPHCGEFDIRVCQIPTIAPYNPEGGVVGEYIDRCIRPTLELQYNSSWSLVSTTVGYRLLSVCTNLVIIVKVGRALVYAPRRVRVRVSMAELMHEALF